MRILLVVTSLIACASCVFDYESVGSGRLGAGGVGGDGGSAGMGGASGSGGTAGVGGSSCTVATEAEDCNGKSCNPVTFECSEFGSEDRGTCETCVSDDNCWGSDHRCVEMSYKRLPYPNAETGFCLKIAFLLSEGPPPVYDCDTPYLTVLVDRSSLSGGPVKSYCGIREDLTTCAAVRAHADAWTCAGVGDDACPDGGFCDWIKTQSDGWKELCTYACDQASQCQGPGGEACSEGYCGW